MLMMGAGDAEEKLGEVLFGGGSQQWSQILF